MRIYRLSRSTAFTLLEVLIVMVVIGALAGMAITSFSPNSATQLQAAASILGRDIEYARNLAVVNSDNYKITFDLTNNRWILTHSGANPAFDALPINAFHLSTDPVNQQIVTLNTLPSIGGAVRLFDVWALTTTPTVVGDVEFLPAGGTTRAQSTLIWLAAGSGGSTRFISVRVNPVTGLFWVENFQATTPSPGTFTGS